MGMRSSVSFRVVPGWTLSAISTPVTGEDRCDAAKQDKDKARPSCREELPTSGERAVHIPRSPQRAAPLCGKRTSLFSSSRRSEEHTSELQSLMRISYAVFCLKT